MDRAMRKVLEKEVKRVMKGIVVAWCIGVGVEVLDWVYGKIRTRIVKAWREWEKEYQRQQRLEERRNYHAQQA